MFWLFSATLCLTLLVKLQDYIVHLNTYMRSTVGSENELGIARSISTLFMLHKSPVSASCAK